MGVRAVRVTAVGLAVAVGTILAVFGFRDDNWQQGNLWFDIAGLIVGGVSVALAVDWLIERSVASDRKQTAERALAEMAGATLPVLHGSIRSLLDLHVAPDGKGWYEGPWMRLNDFLDESNEHYIDETLLTGDQMNLLASAVSEWGSQLDQRAEDIATADAKCSEWFTLVRLQALSLLGEAGSNAPKNLRMYELRRLVALLGRLHDQALTHVIVVPSPSRYLGIYSSKMDIAANRQRAAENWERWVEHHSKKEWTHNIDLPNADASRWLAHLAQVDQQEHDRWYRALSKWETPTPLLKSKHLGRPVPLGTSSWDQLIRNQDDTEDNGSS